MPLEVIAQELGKDLDPFDLICHVAFDKKPLTRRERAENVKKRDAFTKYGAQARAVLDALLAKYADEGVLNLDDTNVLRVPPIDALGTPVGMNYITASKFASLSGGKLLPGDQIYCLRGSLGKHAIFDLNCEAAIASSLVILRPVMAEVVPYLTFYFDSDVAQILLRRFDNGTAQPNLSSANLRRYEIPLPPLGEQRRIVKTINELMTLCDRLEAARIERELSRDRLMAASLKRLNIHNSETFQSEAGFALRMLPAFTARPDQIKSVRQTILNLAVRGKLVSQDPRDEPASELLKRVHSLPKPARYEKRSPELIPGDCGLSINHPSTQLPEGWLWVPLTQIARLESGHTPSRNRPDWWGGDVPWIGLVDARLHNNSIIFDTIQTTNEEGLANSAARLLPKGTVCFSRTASVGYVVIMGRPMATSQDFVNWVPTDAISSEWLQLVMIAERPAINRFSKGAVHQTIYYPAWLSMHIALPPLAEQFRIVTKVEELMMLCERLEASLVAGDDTRRRLLNALLFETMESIRSSAA